MSGVAPVSHRRPRLKIIGPIVAAAVIATIAAALAWSAWHPSIATLTARRRALDERCRAGHVRTEAEARHTRAVCAQRDAMVPSLEQRGVPQERAGVGGRP